MNVPDPSWQLLVQGTWADLFIVPTMEGGEPIVAKVLRELTAEARRAFAREYRVLNARLPGVVRILGGDPNGPRPYYFMPFFAGGTLTERAGALEHSLLRSVARWLAQTFAAMHATDMQHGDIKPDNVLVTERGTAQVSDPLGNGSGCTISWGTKWGGTPGYMAPEIVAGGSISKAGDVFSLGATLFHLATGMRPVDGIVLDPAAYGVSLPSDLRQAIVAMCQRDPTRRPTMHQVAEFLAPPQVKAAVPPPPPAPRKPPTSPSTEVPGWLKAVGWGLAFAAGAAVVNGTTKTWDSKAGRYRGRDGRFRGDGLFD
jgi:serine/threonine protein kinase